MYPKNLAYFWIFLISIIFACYNHTDFILFYHCNYGIHWANSLINSSDAPAPWWPAAAVEKRALGYQFQPRIVTVSLYRLWWCGVYVIIQEFTTKQRVNLGSYENESKKDRYMKGPLPKMEGRRRMSMKKKSLSGTNRIPLYLIKILGTFFVYFLGMSSWHNENFISLKYSLFRFCLNCHHFRYWMKTKIMISKLFNVCQKCNI